jgi:hypothetical protein
LGPHTGCRPHTGRDAPAGRLYVGNGTQAAFGIDVGNGTQAAFGIDVGNGTQAVFGIDPGNGTQAAAGVVHPCPSRMAFSSARRFVPSWLRRSSQVSLYGRSASATASATR